MNIFLTLFRTVSCLLVLISNTVAANSNEPCVRICILKTVEHPALDSTTQGLIDALEKAGYKRGKNLDLRVESAPASPALAAQIAAKFVAQEPDIAVGVATIASQALAKYTQQRKLRVVFTTVTDPVGAGLVQAIDKPTDNITGVSNFVPLEPQIELFKQLQPDLKTLGILYNPGEANSVSIVNQLEKLCPQMGIVLIKQAAPKTADVPQSASMLAYKAQAIFVSNDNTVLGSLPAVIKAANAAKIPVYVSDVDAVPLGVLAALGPSQYCVGEQMGAMIARILSGTPLSALPVEFPQKTQLVINKEAANTLGITIPASIIKQLEEAPCN